ncbi:MAG: phosphatidylserine decarboxylase [Candidatus Heimdallarchaeota archaeon]
MRLAKGHEIITLALLTLLPVLLFYGLVYPTLLILIPVFLILLGGHLMFFRDPSRTVSTDARTVLAPADGKIYAINPSQGIIRIRMSLFNVHVTRAPITGTITTIQRKSGKNWPFFSFLHLGTVENARQTIWIASSTGKFSVVQIVGILARRAICYLNEGESVQQGERLGMIRYGSEVDVHLPSNKYRILVKENDRTVAGITRLAELKGGSS